MPQEPSQGHEEVLRSICASSLSPIRHLTHPRPLPTGPRRLLLHKREIRKLADAIDQKGLTLVPLSAYFNDKSCLKVSIGLARGKKLQDKREDLKRKDIDRDLKRQIKNFG